MIQGKLSDGSFKYPCYKLEYDVFWALRVLSNNSEKSLEILSTAKFQLKNAKGEVKEYAYLKELRMPTRTSKGYVEFDDEFAKSLETSNLRKINVNKLLRHTTAGARWMYQRINMNFTQASESVDTYSLSWHKIIRDIYRKEEQKIYKMRYLKTVARDLRDNGSIDITEEQIKAEPVNSFV